MHDDATFWLYAVPGVDDAGVLVSERYFVEDVVTVAGTLMDQRESWPLHGVVRCDDEGEHLVYQAWMGEADSLLKGIDA